MVARTCQREGCEVVYYVKLKRQKYCCVECSTKARRGRRPTKTTSIDKKWLVRGTIAATANYSRIENGN